MRLVKYAVENTRVGQITDYDKLILEIWTDGRITPDDALKQAASILKHHLDVFDRVSEEAYEFESQQSEVSEEQNKLRKLLNMSVNEIELSVRAANCLNNANITTVGELAMKTEQEMLKYRNFGKKSLNEIKEKLEALGLSLGMKFDERLLDAEEGSLIHAPQQTPRLPGRHPRAPRGDAVQPRRLAHHARPDQDHADQGQGPAPVHREGDHQGQARRGARPRRRTPSTCAAWPCATSATRTP